MLNSFVKYASGRWSNAIVSSSDPLPVEIIGGGYDLSTLIVEDSLGTKFIRRELINTEGIVTIVYEDFDGLSAVPVAPITIASTVLPVGASTSAKQDELRGTQGTGSSYDPPTGGSGVFGWLSGTYKEIVSGIKLKIGGSDVSSSNPLPVQNPNAAPTNRSSTITTGGAAQVAMAALSTRKAYFFQNVSSEIMWGSFTGTAAPNAAGSFPIQPNGIIRSTQVCETTALSIYGATTGKVYTAWEM